MQKYFCSSSGTPCSALGIVAHLFDCSNKSSSYTAAATTTDRQKIHRRALSLDDSYLFKYLAYSNASGGSTTSVARDPEKSGRVVKHYYSLLLKDSSDVIPIIVEPKLFLLCVRSLSD